MDRFIFILAGLTFGAICSKLLWVWTHPDTPTYIDPGDISGLMLSIAVTVNYFIGASS